MNKKVPLSVKTILLSAGMLVFSGTSFELANMYFPPAQIPDNSGDSSNSTLVLHHIIVFKNNTPTIQYGVYGPEVAELVAQKTTQLLDAQSSLLNKYNQDVDNQIASFSSTVKKQNNLLVIFINRKNSSGAIEHKTYTIAVDKKSSFSLDNGRPPDLLGTGCFHYGKIINGPVVVYYPGMPELNTEDLHNLIPIPHYVDEDPSIIREVPIVNLAEPSVDSKLTIVTPTQNTTLEINLPYKAGTIVYKQVGEALLK